MKLAKELRERSRDAVVHISLQYMGASTPYAACSDRNSAIWVSKRQQHGAPTCLLCIARWEMTWAKNEQRA